MVFVIWLVKGSMHTACTQHEMQSRRDGLCHYPYVMVRRFKIRQARGTPKERSQMVLNWECAPTGKKNLYQTSHGESLGFVRVTG